MKRLHRRLKNDCLHSVGFWELTRPANHIVFGGLIDHTTYAHNIPLALAAWGHSISYTCLTFLHHPLNPPISRGLFPFLFRRIVEENQLKSNSNKWPNLARPQLGQAWPLSIQPRLDLLRGTRDFTLSRIQVIEIRRHIPDFELAHGIIRVE